MSQANVKALEDNPIMHIIAANLATVRKRLGLSRPKLAEQLDVHVNSVYQWETCRAECSQKMIFQIARISETPWLWFYQDHARSREPRPFPEDLEPYADEIIRLARGMRRTGTDGPKRDVTDL